MSKKRIEIVSRAARPLDVTVKSGQATEAISLPASGGGPKPRTQSKVRTDSWRSQRIGQLTTAVFTAAFEPVKKRIEAVQNSAHP